MKTHTCTKCGGTGQIPDARMILDAFDKLVIIDAIKSGTKQRDLAAQYGVHESTISRIKHGTR